MKKGSSKSVTTPAITLDDVLSDRSGINIMERLKFVAAHFGIDEGSVLIGCVWKGLKAEVQSRREYQLYKSIDQIALLSPLNGDSQLIGFDVKGKLVHVKGLTVREVSLKESVRLLRELQGLYCDDKNPADWSTDTLAMVKWLKMVEKALK